MRTTSGSVTGCESNCVSANESASFNVSAHAMVAGDGSSVVLPLDRGQSKILLLGCRMVAVALLMIKFDQETSSLVPPLTSSLRMRMAMIWR